MGARLEGLMQTQAKINAALRRAGGAAREELALFGLAVVGESARRAPVETGDLRAAHVVEVNGERYAHVEADAEGSVNVVQDREDVPQTGTHAVVRIGTAGVPYAARQHEELGYNHPKGGQAKFLESALNDLSPTLLKRVEEAAKKGARGE